MIRKLLVEKRFPAIWLPTKKLLDLRALLLTENITTWLIPLDQTAQALIG